MARVPGIASAATMLRTEALERGRFERVPDRWWTEFGRWVADFAVPSPGPRPQLCGDLYARANGVTGHDASLRATIAEDRLNFRVAQMIHEKRSAAGLTQAQLAKLVGTTQSVIATFPVLRTWVARRRSNSSPLYRRSAPSR